MSDTSLHLPFLIRTNVVTHPFCLLSPVLSSLQAHLVLFHLSFFQFLSVWVYNQNRSRERNILTAAPKVFALANDYFFSLQFKQFHHNSKFNSGHHPDGGGRIRELDTAKSFCWNNCNRTAMGGDGRESLCHPAKQKERNLIRYHELYWYASVHANSVLGSVGSKTQLI